MRINCDIGERGAHHPIDRELMRHIDIANIACGGHAGDEASIAAFRALAEQHGVEVSAHLSYPDREHFGRHSLDIDWIELSNSLDEQMNRMPGIFTVKFHGALYNDSVTNPVLAKQLAAWLLCHNITTLIAPADSEMARTAKRAGITLMAEAFADRRYCRNKNGHLQMVSRSNPQAVFQTLENALQQCHGLLEQRVRLIDGEETGIHADTLCVHSDSDIALPLIKALPPFEIIRNGLSRFVSEPATGKQSVGITPGGPQDRFSFETAHALLETETKQSLEFIIPPILKVTHSARFILTGAHVTGNLPHATIFHAKQGDILRFGIIQTGLRAYLSWDRSDKPVGQQRPPLNELVTWNDPQGRIRLLPGPEIDWLTDPSKLISNPWKISPDSNAMGIRLNTPGKPLEIQNQNMISAPVADGTVQLTPSGPIILMRNRQTIGGYPRIANVIEVDLDRLAQFRPGETIRFTWTDITTARDLLAQQRTSITSTILSC